MKGIDSQLNIFWQSIVSSPKSFIHSPMVEAYVAGGSFMVWIIIFRLMDRIQAFQQYRLCPSNINVVSPSLQQILLDSSDMSSWVPLFLYFLAIRVYHVLIKKRPVALESPRVARLIIELICGLIAYDFIFYFFHRFMHFSSRIPQLASFINHQFHHEQVSGSYDFGMIASQVQHHSFIDASLQVMTNILIQNLSLPVYGRKHDLSRLLHNIIITFLLTESHAGYKGWYSDVYPVNLLYGGARYHELHHTLGNVHYQQFFTYLDYIFMTVEK
jgi:sterol desaturase/sphingolipid hydroxylase (fatty acid hydroxylase superfamily)